MRRLATFCMLVLLAWVPETRADEPVGGTPITPEFAQMLYSRVGPLQEPDGCRLSRFDTSRFRISVALVTRAGTAQVLELGTPGQIASGRTIGDWAIAVPAPLARDCPTTVAAIERILIETSAPSREMSGPSREMSGPTRETSAPTRVGAPLSPWWRVADAPLSAPSHYALLAATFLLVLLGTVHVLYREATARAAPSGAVIALILLWAVALGLRLWVSPWTFLHEYYHITETVRAYFSHEVVPGYGKTGPALFRVVGQLLGDRGDVRIIFLTNAVISSLAIPAAAMLVLAVFRSWPQALCAALLLGVLPQHLRFSAAEDLFVQAITFGLWSLALFASYQRTRRPEDAVLGALAASLATQSRPEMIFFPAVAGVFFVLAQPRGWRVLLAWPTYVAAALFAVLLVPHALDVMKVMREARAPAPHAFAMQRYFETLVLLDPRVTPTIYPVMIAIGAVWAAIRRPGWLLWIVAVYVGFTVFALSIYDNPPYHLRVQNLPTSYLVLLAAGAVPVWMAVWRRRRQLGAVLGIALLVLSAVGVVARWRGFVGELKDQQLEWAFLERRVPELPAQGTLITAVEAGGHNLDAFPDFLLTRSARRYALVDVRNAAKGTVAWPEATGELLFYQGMFCYFAFEDEPSPDPMTPVCRAVHERYMAEPLLVEDLHTEGYSSLRYAQGGRGVYRIGFYRLTPRT